MIDNKESKDAQAKPAPATAAEHKPAAHPQAHEKPNIITMIKQHPLAADAIFILALLLAVGGFLYWQDLQGKVYIEKAEISAPVIALSPSATGAIDKFYVEEGDEVSQGQKLAKVGDEIITAKTAGTVVWIQNTPGQTVTPQQPVVKMIDSRQFRVVGRIEEDKGLSDIKVGQKVLFTVDAFPGRQYQGVVDSIGTTARESDIVFSISDKRAEHEFDVYAIYDVRTYSELKDGMSAKMWIYK